MYNSVHCVETMGDHVKILSITAVVAPENSISYMIRNLNKARRAGIYKKWSVSDVLEPTPLSADLPELSAQFLK